MVGLLMTNIVYELFMLCNEIYYTEQTVHTNIYQLCLLYLFNTIIIVV